MKNVIANATVYAKRRSASVVSALNSSWTASKRRWIAAPSLIVMIGSSSIGSSESADIRIGRDPALLGYHATLRDLKPQVKVEPELAERARVPIERMVAITP